MESPVTAPNEITIVVADDHRVVRAGLVALLAQQKGLRVVGEAGTGEEAIRQVQATRPRVVLMDLQMPGMGGIEATREIRARWPETEVLVLTTFHDDELIWGGIRAGARGYLLKDTPPDELFRAIQTVAEGRTLLPPEILSRLTHVIQQGGPASSGAPSEEPVEPLTERELETLRLMARGYSNKEIAQTLYISENTVKTHISSIFRKLEVTDRTEAATKALRLGLIEL